MARKPTAKHERELAELPIRNELEVATLSRAIETRFDLRPDGPALERISAFLGLERVTDLRFRGEIAPRRKDEWRLMARLTAALEQACVVSLTPVPEKIDEIVERDLLPGPNPELEDELELGPHDDEGPDYFQDIIDIGAIALEQLSLAMDPYPRAPDAAMNVGQFTEPGIKPLTDDDVKPFASLAELKDKLSGTDQ
ncbi:MAG: DUF177 domain-containing protein [Pseudomonadota bacterium]